MIRGRSAPLVVGCLGILGLGAFLAVRAPMPGGLASPHASVGGDGTIHSCASCHADGGLARGCLDCHEDIAAQVAAGKGWHGFLLRGQAPECASCHPEHLGEDFPLVSALSWRGYGPEGFRHAHVAFGLVGRHSALGCDACHDPRTAGRKPGSFLGLSQDCAACHEDIHSRGSSRDCESCHGQDGFVPTAGFDHAVHMALAGGHAGLPCERCHVLPDARSSPAASPFSSVRGTECAECHASPHRARFAPGCEGCHQGTATTWAADPAGMSPEIHAAAGFDLSPPHAGVACSSCHDPGVAYPERYPDPISAGYRRSQEACDGCHRDPHEGQFAARSGGCLSCHETTRFAPHRFGAALHAATWPLAGAHGAVPCSSCHGLDPADGARRFAGTSGACSSCHEDPHGGQFAAASGSTDCATCHGSSCESFRIRPFDHAARTGYALEGAHAAADCSQCHEERHPGGSGSRLARAYRGTRQDCASCHRDVHRGQLSGAGACDGCHRSFDSWSAAGFDHDRRSRFPLDGAHRAVACGGCHPSVRLPDGSQVTQYKPLSTECRSCHAIVPGQ